MEFIEERWASNKPKATHCPQGHAYTPENTYYSRGKYARCRTCLDMKRGWVPPSKDSLITPDDRRKIRAFRRTTPKKRKAIEKYKDYLSQFKDGFKHPVDPTVKALSTIAMNNFTRERKRDYQ